MRRRVKPLRNPCPDAFARNKRSMSREVEKKSPGAILKDARLAMGLNLQDVAAISRIPRTQLSHLEANRFDEYSAEVFVRGHLRGYARELQLDPEVVIQAYERYTGRHTDAALTIPERKNAAIKSISRAQNVAKKQVAGLGSQVTNWTQGVRASHLVAVGLVLVFIFIVVNFLTGSRATATDPAQFPPAADEQWEVEQAAQETRWALEQPAEQGDDDAQVDELP